MPTIDALKAIDGQTPTTNEVAMVIDYWDPTNIQPIIYGRFNYGRGGGFFRWRPFETEPPDDGQFIEPTTNGNFGRWERMLQGEPPNVKMWGARGDGVHDDTVAIQNACNATARYPFHGDGWAQELVIPAGIYIVTNTIVFECHTHLRGEGPHYYNSSIVMATNVNKDILRTLNADQTINSGSNSTNYDDGMLVENLYLGYAGANTANACLTICQPGEAHAIRNIWTSGGGYGIRCLGVGAPGLRLRDVSTFQAAIAGVSIEGGNNTVSLIGLSGDNNDVNTTASLVRLYQCCADVTVQDFKAEGYWNSLFKYERYGATPGHFGSLAIRGGTWNTLVPQNGATNKTLVALSSDDWATAAVSIDHVSLYGVPYLIRDALTGRNVEADACVYGNNQSIATAPILYDSVNEGTNWPTPFLDPLLQARSKLVIGQTALHYFTPNTTGCWYRVMGPARTDWNVRLGGKLVISSRTESTELHVDVNPNANDMWMNVVRSSKDTGLSGSGVLVTKARAGWYYDALRWYPVPFLDIYVDKNLTGANNDKEKRITLAHSIDGMEMMDYGLVQLLTPTTPLTNIVPPGCTLQGCVTNSLVR